MSSTLSAPLEEFLADMIPRAAARAHRRFRQVPAEDFGQAMWARVLSNTMKFEKLFAEDRGGIIWVELRRDAAKVGREDDRYRRAVSAAEAGYSVYDVEFYSTRMLGHLLPALVEADFDASRAMETASAATDAAGVHVRVSDPFSGAENYLVVLVDVAGAYGRLPE